VLDLTFVYFSSHHHGDINFNIEYTPQTAFSTATQVSRNSASPSSSTKQSSVGGGGVGLVSSPSIINHLDAITDMVITQVPYPMAIASGRDGVIKVWT
jgi:phosphoinositide-3-kinase regulatory subunit 4